LFTEKAFVITVTNVNEAPVITGQTSLTTEENTALTIVLGNLTVTDVDNTYPTDFTLTVMTGTNYTVVGTTITPVTGFVGTLTVPVKVNDCIADSNTFNLSVSVTALPTYLLSISKDGTGTGTVTSSPAGINCGTTGCSFSFEKNTLVTLTATPTDNYNRLLNWTGCTSVESDGTCIVNVNAAKSVVATFEKATFSDVPFDHPRWAYVEALWDNGYTAGCQMVGDPLKFCPEKTMNRAESAVFMLRGKLGAIPTPTDAEPYVFGDDWTGITWAIPWAEKMWDEGMTAGCQYPAGSTPKLFCPGTNFTRNMGAVFVLRIKHGANMPVPVGTGNVFADMTSLVSSDGIGVGWAEQAYAEGLLPNCGIDSVSGKPLFCPADNLDRSWSAYAIVQAKGLTLP
jgi:hypothetical protein